jgi:hypothetical protein
MAFCGTPHQALTFFQAHARIRLQQYSNPFEYLIEALSTEGYELHDRLVQGFSLSPSSEQLGKEIEREVDCQQGQSPPLQRTSISVSSKAIRLFQRHFRHIARNPKLLLLHNTVHLVVGVVVGLLYFNLQITFAGVISRAGLLFFAFMFLALMSTSILGSYIEGQLMMCREKSLGYYSTFSFFWSRLLVDFLPFGVMPPCIFGTVIYFLAGFRSGLNHFAIFLLFLVLANLACLAIVFCISALFRSFGASNLIIVLIFMYSLIVGGPLLTFDKSSMIPSTTAGGSKETFRSVPQLVKHSSFIHYTYESLIANELVGQSYSIPVPHTKASIHIKGEDLLVELGLKADTIWSNAIIVFTFIIALHLCTLVALVHRKRIR